LQTSEPRHGYNNRKATLQADLIRITAAAQVLCFHNERDPIWEKILVLPSEKTETSVILVPLLLSGGCGIKWLSQSISQILF